MTFNKSGSGDMESSAARRGSSNTTTLLHIETTSTHPSKDCAAPAGTGRESQHQTPSGGWLQRYQSATSTGTIVDGTKGLAQDDNPSGQPNTRDSTLTGVLDTLEGDATSGGQQPTRKRKSVGAESNFNVNPNNMVGVKRRAVTGILNTALGWARSQAAELEAFKQAQQESGTIRGPPPALPAPTRRLAAAQHDLMKAHQVAARQLRGSLAKGSTSRGPNQRQSSLNAAPQARGQQSTWEQQSYIAFLSPGEASAAFPGVHPVALAFTNGSDAQLADAVAGELSRMSANAEADPDRYSALAEECRAWAQGLTPTVRALTSADLERAQKALREKHQHAVRLHGQIDPSSSHRYWLQNTMRSPYFLKTIGGHNGADVSEPRVERPRRSARTRNAKRDELFVPLDSDEGEASEDNSAGGNGGRPHHVPPTSGDEYPEVHHQSILTKRGPGRPRKDGGRPGGQELPRGTPPAFLLSLPNTISPPNVLSPFAQFMLDQGDPTHASGRARTMPCSLAVGAISPQVPISDLLDFTALEDFISGLNFSNDALLTSPTGALPVALNPQNLVVPPSGGGTTAVASFQDCRASPPGVNNRMIPTHALPVSSFSVAVTVEDLAASATAFAADLSTEDGIAPARADPIQAQPPVLDAVPLKKLMCAPEEDAAIPALPPLDPSNLLDTPSLEGLLTLGPAKRSPLLTSPTLPQSFSPTMMAFVL